MELLNPDCHSLKYKKQNKLLKIETWVMMIDIYMNNISNYFIFKNGIIVNFMKIVAKEIVVMFIFDFEVYQNYFVDQIETIRVNYVNL